MESAGAASPIGASRHNTPNRAGTRHPCLVLSERNFGLHREMTARSRPDAS
jgi:hypothetical protein